jgi:hypothetical protein
VHRAIPVEVERVVAAALPRLGLGAGAALLAGLGRAGKREEPSVTGAEAVRSVPVSSAISAIVRIP